MRAVRTADLMYELEHFLQLHTHRTLLALSRVLRQRLDAAMRALDQSQGVEHQRWETVQ